MKAIIRFNPLVTRPWFSITALLSPMKALEIEGRLCIVRTLLGQNPRVSSKNFESSFTSGSASGGKGEMSGMKISPFGCDYAGIELPFIVR
jgi:hypothetical protein